MRGALLTLLLFAATSAVAGGGHVVTVSAAVLSKNNCRFSTAASAVTLAIDPASGAAASGGASVTFRCIGSAAIAAWTLTHDSGLHGANPSALRMRHASAPAEFLPYTLSHPGSGSAPRNIDQTLSFTATVAAADFQNALPGAYSDTVTLSLLP